MSKAQIYFILALVFAFSVALFAIQNTEPISINFLVWQYTGISKVIVILGSTAVGAMTAMLLGLYWQLKKLKQIRQLESEIKELQAKQTETAAGEGQHGTSQDTKESPAERTVYP